MRDERLSASVRDLELDTHSQRRARRFSFVFIGAGVDDARHTGEIRRFTLGLWHVVNLHRLGHLDGGTRGEFGGRATGDAGSRRRRGGDRRSEGVCGAREHGCRARGVDNAAGAAVEDDDVERVLDPRCVYYGCFQGM